LNKEVLHAVQIDNGEAVPETMKERQIFHEGRAYVIEDVEAKTELEI
jgi:hypothetical protein